MFGKESLKFVQDLGRPLKLASRENSAFLFLLQRLSVAIQQGDAASVMGSLGSEQGFFGLRADGDLFCVTYVLFVLGVRL